MAIKNIYSSIQILILRAGQEPLGSADNLKLDDLNKQENITLKAYIWSN